MSKPKEPDVEALFEYMLETVGLSPWDAFYGAIYHLQEEMHVLPCNWEICTRCGGLFDIDGEGFSPTELPGHFHDDCSFKVVFGEMGYDPPSEEIGDTECTNEFLECHAVRYLRILRRYEIDLGRTGCAYDVVLEGDWDDDGEEAGE